MEQGKLEQRERLPTPAMIEAGIKAYEEARPGEASGFNERNVVVAIYSAMERVAQGTSALCDR
jgi:hypothetical protein